MMLRAWLPALSTAAMLACIAQHVAYGESRLAQATARCRESGELLACYDALNLKPNDPDLLLAEADTLVRSGRPGEAIGVYRNAMSLGAGASAVNPKIAQARLLRDALVNRCLNQQGVGAVHACESAWLPGALDEVAVFKRRGLLLQSAGDFSAALDAYLAAARLAPKDRAVSRAIVALMDTDRRKDAAALAALAAAKARLASRPGPAPSMAPADVRPGNDAEVTRSN